DINIKADQSYFMQAVTTLIDTGIGFAQRGTILISTQLNSCQNAAEIIINIPCSIDHWQGETSELELSNLNLTTFKKWSSTLEISPSMKLVLSQILLEKMKGQLTLSDSSPENAPKTLTQLQFLIPLATTLENHLLMREC
ncbi:MAG: sensor histidine kinase, partial [Cyanobacteria bacterium P01_G01_bin.49]